MCKSGQFKGEVCSDLSNRVLVGEGHLGRLLELKDATLPDHAHRHNHNGTYNFKARYRSGPERYTDSGKALGWREGSGTKKHHHNEYIDIFFPIDFSNMTESEAFITKKSIQNPNITLAQDESENLYSPHMRVKYMFKCL